MSHYKHLSIEEREKLYLMLNQGISIRKIAVSLNRSPSTVSWEIRRNQIFFKPYSPSIAQTRYQNRRKQCGRKRILLTSKFKEKVRALIQDNHWSPEQVSFRLKFEHNPISISYATIYRGIHSGMFDPKKCLKKNEKFSFSLRRKNAEKMENYPSKAALKYPTRLRSDLWKRRITPSWAIGKPILSLVLMFLLL